MTIDLLPQSVIEKISAGEVIENPSSIVKELLENSIDSGAQNINISIEEGGKKLIKITDDGCGMSPEDSRKCILRHATSKIRNYDDLAHIITMGFRGEALASIAAVSRMELITKTEEMSFAEHFIIEENTIQKVEKCASVCGTTVIVNDLFYNVPVRKKFLKSNSSEYTHINVIIEKLAISHPYIAFTFTNNDKIVFQTTGSGELTDVVAKFFGAGFLNHTYDIDCLESNISVRGLLGNEQFTWHNRSRQIFFVNNRYVQNKILSNALMVAYKKFFQSPNKFPQAIIFIDIDPELVDVNIHPRKAEIKFANEDQIFDVIYHSITKTISHVNLHESEKGLLNFCSVEPPLTSDVPSSTYKEVSHMDLSVVAEGQAVETNNYLLLSCDIDDDQKVIIEKIGEINISKIEVLGTYLDTFILCKDHNSFYIIDQHAAHERILYEKFLKEKKFDTQLLLVPVLLKLAYDTSENMKTLQHFLFSSGFTISFLGNYDWAVTGIPKFLLGINIEEFFNELFEIYSSYKKSDFLEKIVARAACKASVKSGQNLSFPEIKELLSSLSKTESPTTCPHGRPTYIELKRTDFEKMFKR